LRQFTLQRSIRIKYLQPVDTVEQQLCVSMTISMNLRVALMT
jgi:hypothetical protein